MTYSNSLTCSQCSFCAIADSRATSARSVSTRYKQAFLITLLIYWIRKCKLIMNYIFAIRKSVQGQNACLCALVLCLRTIFFLLTFIYFSLFGVGSWESGPCPRRAFVPHSPMDLQIGHRVRILLPTGRISTGTLRYLGQPHGSSDFYLGVELEQAENVKQTGIHEGQCYFDW